TMPIGDSIAPLYLHGLPMFPPTGVKSAVIDILSPYNCSGGTPTVLGTDSIWIYDSIYVEIINPDTVICYGESVLLEAIGDSTLFYSWYPDTLVNNPIGNFTYAIPDKPTTYTVTVSLDPMIAAGCPPSTDQVFINVKTIPIVDSGPDMISCGSQLQLNAAILVFNPDETFEWSPVTGLSNPFIRDPMCTPLNEIEYIIKVNAGAADCDGYDTIVVTLFPGDIEILTPDTVVCSGAIITMTTNGHSAFTYNWYPEKEFDDPF